MAKTKLLGKAGPDALHPGEEPLAVVRANKPGNLKKSAVAGGVGGIIGVAIASKMDKSAPAAGIIDIPRMVLALTPTRMLVFSVSAMTAKAKTLELELPITDFVDVEVGEGKVFGMKMVPIGFQLKNDQAFAVEVPFVDRNEADVLATELKRLIAG